MLTVDKVYKYRNKTIEELISASLPWPTRDDRILFWVPGGMDLMLHVEGSLALALMMRGAKVQAVICDGVYKACVRRQINDEAPVEEWGAICEQCVKNCSAVLERLKIPYTFIGEAVDPATRAVLADKAAKMSMGTILHLEHEGLNVGKNAVSAILRYLQGYPLDGHEAIVPEYAYSALLVAESAKRILDDFNPTRLYMSHGIYCDWGPALRTAFSRGLASSAWMGSHLKGSFYFQQFTPGDYIDFQSVTDEGWEERLKDGLNEEQRSRIAEFINTRYIKNHTHDMKKFAEYVGDSDRYAERFGLDGKRPVWGVMTHINWDSVSDYSPMLYDSFDDWIIDTICEIRDVDDVQWLIKIHPGELLDNAEGGVKDLIDKHFDKLPDHITLIEPEEDISPHDFYHLIDGVVTVYGTGGLEMSMMGKPAILAGSAYYGQRGFTHDGPSVEGYRELLKKASGIGPLTEEERERALHYGYHLFIQRQTPYPVVFDPDNEWYSFQDELKGMLLPGGNEFVDFLCDRILDGKEFIMDENLVELADRLRAETVFS